MAQLPFGDQGGPALKLWCPGAVESVEARVESQEGEERGDETASDCAQDSGGAHRIVHPVRTPALLFEELAESHVIGPQHVPESQVTKVRETLTLPEFYKRWMQPWRVVQLESGKIKPGTASKDRTTMNRWQKWELEHPPENWPTGPADREWVGLPIGYIRGGYLDKFYDAMKQQYAKQTVISTRNHLRTIVNFALQIGALATAPQASPLDLDDPDDVEEDLATVWSEDEINLLYKSMRGNFDLQAALVLACNCGPRTIDIFKLRWEKNIRFEEEVPMLRFRAIKSKKLHGIPLHPVVVAHLRRLQSEQLFEASGPLFPRLGSIDSKDPERSRPSRRRNKLIKRLMEEAGLPAHNKPWQVCRATTCTRINDVKKGVGAWVIGQGSDRAGTKLAADFYDNPTEDVVRTILSAPQPEAFTGLGSRV